MIGSKMRERVLEAMRKFGPEHENLLARYLELNPDEKVHLSVWVDLLSQAGDTSTIDKMDPEGIIRAQVAQKRLPSFSDWWGVIPSADQGQLSLFD